MKPEKEKAKIVIIAGASGFIGQLLSTFLRDNGFQIKPLNRADFNLGVGHVKSLMEGADIVINLSGAPIARKWTSSYKEEIYNSRVLTTGILVQAVRELQKKPELFISSSAVGIYNSIDVHDEFSDKYSNDFLGHVCRNWEHQAYNLMDIPGIRLVVFRLGIVLSRKGGAFPRMLLPFRFFIGGSLGDGLQWFPYVHVEDVLSAFWFVIQNVNARGVYNIVVPNMVTHHRFCKVLARLVRRPSWLNVPPFVLRLILGEASSVLLEGQHVKPHRLISEGFYFQYPTAEKAIHALLKK